MDRFNRSRLKRLPTDDSHHHPQQVEPKMVSRSTNKTFVTRTKWSLKGFAKTEGVLLEHPIHSGLYNGKLIGSDFLRYPEQIPSRVGGSKGGKIGPAIKCLRKQSGL